MDKFSDTRKKILQLTKEWEGMLLTLNNADTIKRQNSQKRTIKQIVGHLIDSASNNTHRIIHLQYQKNPCDYPDYANLGNNDRWIAIQNYNNEEWLDLIQLWKYSNIHLAHVIQNINLDCLRNEWISALNEKVTLEDMVIDYPRHLKLHLSEIEELMRD